MRTIIDDGSAGPAVLMIHGNGGSIAAFEHNIPYFAGKYRVIVADSRAQGRTRDDGSDLTFEMMADDYAALLAALHVDSAYVIGWSDGGITALLLALRLTAPVAASHAAALRIPDAAPARRAAHELRVSAAAIAKLGLVRLLIGLPALIGVAESGGLVHLRAGAARA